MKHEGVPWPAGSSAFCLLSFSLFKYPVCCGFQIGANMIGADRGVEWFSRLNRRRPVFAGLDQDGATACARAGDDVRKAISHQEARFQVN